MRCVVLADIHLGKRQFPTQHGGRNVREQDIEKAWHAVVDIIVQSQPDLVLCGGDVFEHPRVSSFAVKAWRDGVRRISTETAAHLVVVSGNHDCARSGDVLSPLTMPDDYDRVHIAMDPQRLNLALASGETASVACFPFAVLGDRAVYSLEPDPTADVNCVLIHAAAQTSADGVGALPKFYAGPGALDIGREAERFDLIAAGDYHEFTLLHPTALAFYPGSIERTSSNIWKERDPKGVVLCDTKAGTMEFLEVPTRPMFDYDLGDVAGREPSAESVNHALDQIQKVEEHAGAIVRLKVDDFPRTERTDIDWGLVRKLRSTCTHFDLALRFAKAEAQDLGDRRERRVATLAEEFSEFFTLDDASIRKLAQRYLEIELEAEDLEEVEEEQLQEVSA